MSITKPLPFRTTEKIYQVMYSRASARKFKKWEFDGFIIYKFDEYFNGDDSCLSLVKKLESGKQPVFENRSLDLADKEQEFEPGYQCCMGGYDIEIQELLKKTIKENKHARQRPEEQNDSEYDESSGEEDHVVEDSAGQSDLADFFQEASSSRRGNLAETGFVRPSLSMAIYPAPTPREIAQKRKKNNEPLRLQKNGTDGLDTRFNFSFKTTRPLDPSFAQEHMENDNELEIKKRKLQDPIQHAIGRQLPVDLTENLRTSYKDTEKQVHTGEKNEHVDCDPPNNDEIAKGHNEDSPDFIPPSQNR